MLDKFFVIQDYQSLSDPLKVFGHCTALWEVLVIVLPCGKVLLRIMCLGKPLKAGFWKALG